MYIIIDKLHQSANKPDHNLQQKNNETINVVDILAIYEK